MVQLHEIIGPNSGALATGVQAFEYCDTRPTWFLKKATKHAFMQFDDGFKSAVKRMTAKFNRAKA